MHDDGPLIDIAGLHYRYPGAGRDALDGLDLRVQAGEFVAVAGPNGSGKSTLARLLGGLDRPGRAESALVARNDLRDGRGRMGARRAVGVCFQNPDSQLVATTVEEDLAFGLENLGEPTAAIRARVDHMLASFGLEALATREPHLLSGGQKQRVALAGVLAIPREVLVLDEPTAMVDPAGRDEVLAAVRAENARGMTVVYVTQEMQEVAEAARVVALQGGRAVFDGPPAALFADAPLVERLGLGLPLAAQVARNLDSRGRHLARLPLDLEDLVAALSEVQS